MKILQGIALIMTITAIDGLGEGAVWRTPPVGEHPRLVFSQAQLPELRARLATPRGQRFFELIRANAAGTTLNPRGSVQKALLDLEAAIAAAAETGEAVKVAEHDARAGALLAAENAAFVYVINGDEEYGRAAVEALVKLIPYVKGMSLRPAALIYDWCQPLVNDEEGEIIRSGIGRVSEEVAEEIRRVPFALGPCPINQAIYWGLLLSANLGIGQLAIEGEPGFSQELLELSRECTDKSLMRFLDEEGYHENGPAYVGFGFSWFNFYLEALRLRGSDWSAHPRLSKMPFWYAYLILPGSLDVAPLTVPVGNSNFGATSGQDAFMWLYHAMPENSWASLAYRHVMAPGGYNPYVRALVAQFLWDRPYLPEPDFGSAPRVKWFPDGGVFMRSGWEAQDSVFWLKTQQHRYNTGNHNDYGSFFLHAYGESFAVEAGAKHVSSLLHNLVTIDGKGMDHASYDVMPSSPLIELVDGAFGAAALVDQREAYSEDIFFEGEERRLVVRPLNPMERAQRIGCTIWDGPSAGRYFLIVDDLVKDEEPHLFSWRMMVNTNYEATARADGLTLARAKGAGELANPPELECAMLSPFGSLAMVEATEQLGKEQVPMKRLVAEATVVNPHFTVCLYPRRPNQPASYGMSPLVTSRVAVEEGHGARLSWPECSDRIVVSYGEVMEVEGIRTDARLAVVRTTPGDGALIGFLVVAGSWLEVDGRVLVKTDGAPCSVTADVASGTGAIGIGGSGTITLSGFEMRHLTRYDGTADPAAVPFRQAGGESIIALP